MIALMLTVLAASIVVCAGVFRLSKTSRATVALVRFSVWLLTAIACVAVAAPVLFGWCPDAMHAAVFTALAIHQISTNRLWQHGVPHWFVREVRRHG